MDRSVNTYMDGIYYEIPLYLVININHIRILIATVACIDYEIWKIDVEISFGNGHMSEEVDMMQLKGFVKPKHCKSVHKFQRSIYGLKQTSKIWNIWLEDKLIEFVFSYN